MIARYASVTREMNVPPTCFYPEPAVISSVLRIVMRENQVPPEDELLFSMTVRAAFARRRKTLWNNLRAAGFADETVETVLAKPTSKASEGRKPCRLKSSACWRQRWPGLVDARKILDKRRGI